MKQLFFLLLATLPAFSQQTTGAKLDTLMTAYNKAGKFNGSVLVARKGEILLNKGYGFRNVQENALNTANTIYQIGSVTKQFTATIVLKLQEEKKLGVQDKLNKYYPDFPNADSITVHNLLTHTSGVWNYTTDAAFMNQRVTQHVSKEEMMNMFKKPQLRFTPGTKFEYSNSGYSILGYLISDVTKISWEQNMRKYILNPLRMDHSGFDFTNLRAADKATGYFSLAEPAPIVDSTVSYSAGSLFSTTGDLYKWYNGMKQNKVISAGSRAAGITPMLNNYAYGIGVDKYLGKQTLGHTGGIHGFNSYMTSMPEEDICIILLCNVSNGELANLGKTLYALLFDQPYTIPKERIAIQLTDAQLQEYVGEYEQSADFKVTITVKDGQLEGRPTNQSPKPLYAEKPDLFFVKDMEIQLKFTRDAATNKVNGYILYQNGREVPAKKL